MGLSSDILAGACEDPEGEHTDTAHRADLLDALRAAVPDGTLRLGARRADVSVRGEAGVLTFDDGSEVEADVDVVVGAEATTSCTTRSPPAARTTSSPSRPSWGFDALADA